MAPQLKELFPTTVGIASGAISGVYTLFPDEVPAVKEVRHSRLAEFSLGRELARQALEQIGGPRCSIPADSERCPVWPDGYVGSISHSHGFCIAAAATSKEYKSIGIDVERYRIEDENLFDYICTPSEIADAVRETGFTSAECVALIFSAKESVYKAYFPIFRMFFDFTDVYISLISQTSHKGTFHARSTGFSPKTLSTTGRWIRRRDIVLTSASLE